MERILEEKSSLPLISGSRDNSIKLSPKPVQLGMNSSNTYKMDKSIMITGVNLNESVGTRGGAEEKADSYIFEVNLMPPETLALNITRTMPMDEFTAAKFNRVKNNIVSALTFLRKNTKKPNDTTKDRNSFSVWKDLIGSEYNQWIVNDGFWLVILKKNAEKFRVENKKDCRKKIISTRSTLPTQQREYNDLYYQIENALLDRMACNYHDMLENYEGIEYELFFQVDIVNIAVL